MSFAEDDPGLLEGAVVQRVDVGEDALALRVRAPGRSAVLLIAAAPRARGVGVLEGKSRPRLAGAAPAEVIRLRKRLEGARIAWIEEKRVVVTRGPDRIAVQVGGAGACGVRGIGVSDLAAEEPMPSEAARDRDADPWLTRGAELAEALGEGTLAAAREALASAIRRALAKLARRAEAVRGDLARVDEAAAQASRAALFVAEAARAPRGATSLTVTDWSSGEPVEASLALDPARPAREQIDALFKRARRLKQGGAIAARRLDEAGAAAARLREIAERIPSAADVAAVDALAAEAREAAPRELKLAPPGAAAGADRKPARREASLPYKTFHGASGARILVGKGAAHNDTLTLKIARPHDLWLHAKGMKGAHVIVPRERNEDTPAELLVEAAHLAAHFSDARGEAVVEIQYTPRRYLRKPRGSAPGFVVVDREKVLVLRVDAALAERLLATEVP